MRYLQNAPGTQLVVYKCLLTLPFSHCFISSLGSSLPHFSGYRLTLEAHTLFILRQNVVHGGTTLSQRRRSPIAPTPTRLNSSWGLHFLSQTYNSLPRVPQWDLMLGWDVSSSHRFQSLPSASSPILRQPLFKLRDYRSHYSFRIHPWTW